MKLKKSFLLAASALFICAGSARAVNNQSQLNAQEQKVIDYLLKDWNEDYSVTTIEIAMKATKVEASEEIRFRIGSHIKAHPELHEVIRRWGWVTLVLTPDEKLIARALINAQREGRSMPLLSELAKAVGVKESDIKRGLAMLMRYEIVKESKVGGAGYTVMPRYIKWEPRLDFVFHNVTLDGGRQFSVN